MRVSLIGFELTLGHGIKIEQVLDQLKPFATQETMFEKYHRHVLIGEKDGYWTGLLLTLKDQKKVPEVDKGKQTLSVKVRNLAKRRMVDFNFFVLNQKTLCGLYQQYHQSCSIGRFAHFLKLQYDKIKVAAIESEVASMGTVATENDRKAIAKKFKGSLGYQLMVRPEKFQELIAKLKKIKSFDFDFTTLDIGGGRLTPIQSDVRKVRHSVRFKKETLPGNVAGVLGEFVMGMGLGRGRCEGVDVDGDDIVLKVANNVDIFADYDYDSIVADDMFTIEDIANSTFIAKMLTAAKQDKRFFETPTE